MPTPVAVENAAMPKPVAVDNAAMPRSGVRA